MSMIKILKRKVVLITTFGFLCEVEKGRGIHPAAVNVRVVVNKYILIFS